MRKLANRGRASAQPVERTLEPDRIGIQAWRDADVLAKQLKEMLPRKPGDIGPGSNVLCICRCAANVLDDLADTEVDCGDRARVMIIGTCLAKRLQHLVGGIGGKN